MRLHANAEVVVTFSLTLSEAEARALYAVSGWSADSLVRGMEPIIGKSTLREHEKGLIAFFESVRGQVGPAVEAVRKARADLLDAEVKRRNARIMADAVVKQATGV